MKEKTCNFWDERADYRCIPTTGATDDDGAIMNSGLALEATKRFAGVAIDLGRLLSARGNHVHEIRPGLLSFPIQQFAWGGPSPQRISQSVQELIALVGDKKTLLPRPGVFRGGLEWEQVKPLLENLPDNIIVVEAS